MRFNLNFDDIKYIKISYVDSQNNLQIVKAAIRTINEREILACAKYEDNNSIGLQEEVTLSLICSDGLYTTKTKLKSVTDDDPYVFIYLETPQGIEYQQNREYFRVNVNYNCTYIVEEDSLPLYVHTSDISANGVSIIVPTHEISDGNSKIVIDFIEKEVSASVKYIRSEKVDNGYKISFKFEVISESDRDYISQVCIKKQLEQRRNTFL